MKRSHLIFGLTLSLFTLMPLRAQIFNANANCWYVPGVAYCSTYNNTPYVLSCSVTVYGMTSSGTWINNTITNVLYPGNDIKADVSAINQLLDPIVSAHGYANCQIL